MLQESDFKDLVGQNVDNLNLPPKYFIFISNNDGQSFYRSIEFNPYRINVDVKRGVITRITGVN